MNEKDKVEVALTETEIGVVLKALNARMRGSQAARVDNETRALLDIFDSLAERFMGTE